MVRGVYFMLHDVLYCEMKQNLKKVLLYLKPETEIIQFAGHKHHLNFKHSAIL